MTKVEKLDLLSECKEHVIGLNSLVQEIYNSCSAIDKGLFNSECIVLDSLLDKIELLQKGMEE